MKDLIKALKDAEKTNSALAENQIANAQAFNNHFQGTVAILKAAGDQLTDSAKVVQQNTTSYAKSLKIQKQIGKATKKHYKEIADQEEEIRNLRLELERGVTDERKKAIEGDIEKRNYIMAMEMKHAKKIADYRTTRLSEEAQERETRYKEYQDLMKADRKNMEKLGNFGKSMGNAAKGGDLGGLASGGADGIASILKSLSGVGGKLGAVAGALGATVGVLGMFVALMFEADKKAKDMNKSILQGASGLDLMAGKFEKGKITEKLGKMRDTAFDMGMKFRMSAEEVTNVMSAFNQASLRYDEMAKITGESQERGLERALDSAITASKMLGVEANTVAEQIAQMNENFAMDLSQIDEAFAAIYMSAQTTGIATQKFFAMVTQVTGGMSLLNVDFAQTAAIAGELVESLGEAAGSKFLSDLANRGASMSYKDRLKSSLLSGGKTSRIGKKGVESRSRALEENVGFRDLFTGNTGVMKMLRSTGVAEKLQRRGDGTLDLQASLNEMNQKQRQNFMATIGNTDAGGSAEMERMVRELSELNIAAKNGQSTVQMGKFNTGENLAQFLAESGSFVDLAKGQSMGGMSRMVLEEISGKSGMEVDQLVTMVDKMNSNMGIVKTYSERVQGMMKEGKSGQEALETLAKEQGMNSEEFQTMLEKQYKLTIDESGTVKSSKTGIAIDNLEDYMINMGDSMETIVEEAMSKEDAMTSEIVANTASMSAVLENMIGKVLNDIYMSVEGLYDALVGDRFRNKDKEATRLHIASLKDEVGDIMERNSEIMSQSSELRTKVKSGKASESEIKQLGLLEKQLESNKALVDQKNAERLELKRSGSLQSSQKRLTELRGTTVNTQISEEEQEKMAKEMLQALSRNYIMSVDEFQQDANWTGDRNKNFSAKLTEEDIDDGYYLDFSDFKDKEAVQQLYNQGIPKEVIDRVMQESAYTAYLHDSTKSGGYNPAGDVIGQILDGEGVDVSYDVTSANVGQMQTGQSVVGGDKVQQLINRKSDRISASTQAMGIMDSEKLGNYTELLYEEGKDGLVLQEDTFQTLTSMARDFSTTKAGVEASEEFQRKKLAPMVGAEMMKAMVAEKLFEVATGAGVKMEDLVKAYATKGKKDDRRIRGKVRTNAGKDAGKLLQIMDAFNMGDGLSLPDGTLEQMGKGHLIVTPNGQAITTDPADGVAVGTNIGSGGSGGGGGGGIHIGTVVVKADDPETFKRKLKAVAKTKSGRNAMSGRSR